MDESPSDRSERLRVELERRLLERLRDDWEEINRSFFKGAMRRPLLGLCDSRTRLGLWCRDLRTLEISRHLVLERGWGEVYEVLKHEAAHQFVDECLAVDEGPHGPTFRATCRRLGIDERATVAGGAESAAAGGEPPSHETDHLVARIRKLLALAESPNLHEAENAAAAAQKLMLKFNLAADALAGPTAYRFRHLGRASGRTFEHQRRVAALLDEHFFVKSIWVPVYRASEGKRGTILEVCGREPNLAMAEYVHDFLHGTAERLWRAYRRERALRSDRDHLTFLAGVMRGFAAKLAEQERRFQVQGLVWVPAADLDRYLRGRHPYVQSLTRGGAQRNAAYTDGERAGGGIVLSRPVNAGSSGDRARRALGPGH